MNKLYILKSMGFKVTWKLMTMGLFGNNGIPPLITRADVVEYLDGLLTDINEQTDEIILLICEKDDSAKFDNIMKALAMKDAADIVIQKRKWRACLLKNVIDNISADCLQGLLELMEFWTSMGMPDDCPQTFPNRDSKESIQNYFTQASYEYNLSINREWLSEEIQSIVSLETSV